MKTTANLYLLLACAALADPVPVRFNADAAAPQTFQAAAYRGETLDIEARLTLRGAPLAVADGASATMHWQTNGMAAAWWTAPASVTTSGLVRARWTPAMDCGADAYRVFLGVADGGSNLSYRANMLLRMVGSPGESPNALPLPVQVLDFAKIAWTNAPWGEGGDGIGAPVVRVNIWDSNQSKWVPTNAVLQSSASVEYQIYDTSEDGHPVVAPVANIDFITTAMSVDYVRLVVGLSRVSQTATVGGLVDAINTMIDALSKEEEP